MLGVPAALSLAFNMTASILASQQPAFRGGGIIFPNTPLSDVALRGSTSNGTLSASYIEAGTMSIPAGQWAIGMAFYIPVTQTQNSALWSLGDTSDTLAMNNSSMVVQGNHIAGTVQPFLGPVTATAKDDAGTWLQPVSARLAASYYWTGTTNVRLLRGPKINPAAPYGSGLPTLIVIQKTSDGYIEYWIVEPGATAYCHERQYNPTFGAIAAKQLLIGRYNRTTAGNAPNTANVSLQRFFRTSQAFTAKQIEQLASGVDPRALVTMTQAQGDRLIALTGTSTPQTDLVSGQTINLIGGTFVAAAVTPIPSTIALDTVRAKMPGYNQVVQSSGASSTLPLEGTSLANGPIYARVVDWTTRSTVVTDWQLVATAVGGVWSGQMTGVPRARQWYALQLRAGLSGTVYTVERKFGLGYVASLIGQSWHERFRIANTATISSAAAGFCSRFIRTQDSPYNLGWELANTMGYAEAALAEQMSLAFTGCAASDVSAVNGSPISAWQPTSTAFLQSLDGILLNRIRDLFWQQGQGSTADGYTLYKSEMHSMFDGYKAAIPHPFNFHVSLLAPCATTSVGYGQTNEIQRAQKDFVTEARAAGDTNVYDVCDIQDCALESTGLHALDTAAGMGKIVERYVHHLKWLEGIVANSACGPTITGVAQVGSTAVFRVTLAQNGGTGLQTPNVASVQGFEASLNSDMSSPLTISSAAIIDATTIDITLSGVPGSKPYFTYQAGYPGRIKTLDANGYMDNIGGNKNPVYDNRTPVINTTLGFPVRQMLTPLRAT